MISRFIKILIATIVLFIISLNIFPLSFAYLPAPLNDESTVKQILNNTRIIEEEYHKKGKFPEGGSGINLALFFKETNIEAFKRRAIAWRLNVCWAKPPCYGVRGFTIGDCIAKDGPGLSFGCRSDRRIGAKPPAIGVAESLFQLPGLRFRPQMAVV